MIITQTKAEDSWTNVLLYRLSRVLFVSENFFSALPSFPLRVGLIPFLLLGDVQLKPQGPPITLQSCWKILPTHRRACCEVTRCHSQVHQCSRPFRYEYLRVFFPEFSADLSRSSWPPPHCYDSTRDSINDHGYVVAGTVEG